MPARSLPARSLPARSPPTCHPPRSPARRQAGFSLLEVLIAFAILSLSLGVLLQIFARALDGAALSADYQRAVALAEAKLQAIGSDLPLRAGHYGGAPEAGMDWSVEVIPYRPEGWLGDDPPLAPYRVIATVALPSGGNRRVVLETLRLAPP